MPASPTPRATLILGRVRSGKSRLAERLAQESGLPVTYLATALAEDDEMRARIQAHRVRRRSDWRLVEEPVRLAAILADVCADGRCVLDEGGEAVGRALEAGNDLFIGGEMGIGNTTAATALACALLDLPAAALTGPGTGLDTAGIARKQAVIEQALALHRHHLSAPFAALTRVGGFEIAALTGAYCACAQRGLPMLVDGYISSVAALAATRLCAGAGGWMLLSHASVEPGHRSVVDALGHRPLLDLGMRLGEGSGAAVAVPLLRLACALHSDMATFADTGVANG